jgi:hypothetical protein
MRRSDNGETAEEKRLPGTTSFLIPHAHLHYRDTVILDLIEKNGDKQKLHKMEPPPSAI